MEDSIVLSVNVIISCDAVLCHAFLKDVEFSRVAIYISEFIRYKKGSVSLNDSYLMM